jgi:hypothetical protein
MSHQFFFRSAETAGESALDRLRLAREEEEDTHQHLMAECPWYVAVLNGKNATDHSMCKPAKKGRDVKLVVKLAKPQTLAQANYRDTDSETRNCHTCKFSSHWQGKSGHCDMFDAPIKRGHTCDEWEGGKVSLTPHTAEASTVPKPTVPPGGPGLFHIKDRQLPPYIQHLWHHLAPRYGKHRAYGMAVGIVEKWKAGINPGGRHPTRTHADVRAAAAKNIAQWEKDKADAHAQTRKKEAKRG